MNKVLFISHDATRTGAPILLLNLLLILKKQNLFHIEVLVKNDGGELLHEFQKLCPTRVINTKLQPVSRLKRLIDVRLKLNNLLQLANYVQSFDIVVSNTITNGDLHDILKNHPRVFTYVHELEEGIKFFTTHEHIKNVLAHTNTFLFPSLAVKDILIKKYGLAESNLRELPYFIPDRHAEESVKRELIRYNLGININDIVVVGVGTGDWRKGPDLFLQSILIARTSNPNIKGVWVGMHKIGVEYSRFQYDLNRSLVFDGILILEPNKNPFEILAASDIFFLSSREDPYPLVVLEAAMMNLPLICFEGSGGANEFIDDIIGLKAPYYRADIAAKAICNLAASEKYRNNLGNNARRKYLAIHEEMIVIKKIMNIFK